MQVFTIVSCTNELLCYIESDKETKPFDEQYFIQTSSLSLDFILTILFLHSEIKQPDSIVSTVNKQPTTTRMNFNTIYWNSLAKSKQNAGESLYTTARFQAVWNVYYPL